MSLNLSSFRITFKQEAINRPSVGSEAGRKREAHLSGLYGLRKKPFPLRQPLVGLESTYEKK